MEKSLALPLLIALAALCLLQTANVLPSVKLDYSNTTITQNETIELRAEVNSIESIWYYNDTHFELKQKLWAFDGYHLVCFFSATANDYLE